MNPLRYLFILLLICAGNAFAQPLLSQMEEGDQIRLHVWITGCFQIEDNAYQFEMKEGKTLCTGLMLPDYVTPQRHPRVPVGPIELSKDQIEGIDRDIVQFRQTQIRSYRRASTGVTIVNRSSEISSTTVSEIKLTFIEKGKTIIEETIHCPDFHVHDRAHYKGLADLKRLLRLQAKPELDRIIKKLTEDRQREPTADTKTAD